jgi:hypothetical protein
VHIDLYTADTNRDGVIDILELRVFMGRQPGALLRET